jgi:hypothetical protein
MTDHTSNGPLPAHYRRDLTIEYAVYFAVIFAAALPGAALGWLAGFARADRSQPNRGVVARAWSQARTITPLIFSA